MKHSAHICPHHGPRIFAGRGYRVNQGTLAFSTVLTVVALIVAACSSNSRSTGGGGSGAGGSTTNTSVMLVLGSTNTAPIYLSQVKGYFKDAHLNVKIVNNTQGVALENSALLGGSVDFVLDPLTSVMDLVSAGSKAKMVAAFGDGAAYQLIVRPSKAKEMGISNSSSAQQVLTSFKGSGLKIAVVSQTSDPGLDLADALKGSGILPGKDYSFVYAGSQESVLAAYNAGRVDAIAGNPQLAFTVSGPQPIQVSYSSLPQLAGVAYNGLITTQKLIDTNPSLVQAMVNCYVKAWSYMLHAQPSAIEKDLAPDYKAGGLTSQAAIDDAYQVEYANMRAAGTPAITAAAYSKTLDLKNGTNAVLKPPKKAIDLSQPEVVDNMFVNKAIQSSGLSLKTAP